MDVASEPLGWRFMSARTLLALTKLPRLQDLDPQKLAPAAAFRHRVFVSHRWETNDSPDPKGGQLAVLKRLFAEVETLATNLAGMDSPITARQGPMIAAHLLFRTMCGDGADPEGTEGQEVIAEDLLEQIGIWYDFSCLPQAPRSIAEDAMFYAAMQDLPHLLSTPNVTTLILRYEADDYESRAWCFAEAALAARKKDTNWPFQFWVDRWDDRIPGISESIPFGQAIQRTSLEMVWGQGPSSTAIGWPTQLTLERCINLFSALLAKLETLPDGAELDFATEASSLLGKLNLDCREERDGIVIPLMLLSSIVGDRSQGTVAVLRQAPERFAANLPLRIRRVNDQLVWQTPPLPPAESEWPIFISYRRSALTSEIAKWLKEELEGEALQGLNEQWFRLKVFVDALEPVHGDFQAHLVPHLEHSRMLVILADPGAARRHPQPKRDFLYEELNWWATHRPKTAPLVLELDRTSARSLVSNEPEFTNWAGQSWLECYWEEWRGGSAGKLDQEKQRLLRVLRESIRIYGHDIHLAEVTRLRRAVHRLIGAMVAVFLAACAAAWLALALQHSLQESEARSYALAVNAARMSIRSEEYAPARTALSDAPVNLRGWEWGHLSTQADTAILRLSGHAGGAKAVLFGPEPGTLLSIGADGYLRMWDSATGRERWSTCPFPNRETPSSDDPAQSVLEAEGYLNGSPGLTALAMAPDQKLLAAGNSQGRIAIWNTSTWKRVHTFKAHPQLIISLAFAEPDALLTRGQEGAVKRWELSSQTPTEESISDSEQTGLMVLSPDRTRLALSHGKIVDVGTPTRLELYSLTAGEPPRRFRKGTASQDIIAGMTYIGTNHTLVAADFQGYLVFVGEDDSQPTTMEAVPHSSIGQLPLGSVAASPSGDLLATGDKSGLIRLWDAHTRSLIRTLPGHSADVRALTFSPQADRLASASLDGSIRMWDITTNGTAVYHLPLSEDIWALSLHPSDGSIVAAGDNGRLWLLNAQGQVIAKSEQERDNTRSLLRHSPDGKTLLSIGNYGEWMLWDSANLVPKPYPESPRAKSGCYTSDGRVALLLEDGEIEIRDGDGRQPRTLVSGEAGNPVTAISALEGGNLAGVRKNGLMIILGPRGNTIQTFSLGFEDISEWIVTPECQQMAAASGHSVVWWKRQWTGAWKQQGRIEKAHEEPIRALVFSPDGRRLITGSEDQTCRVRDLATGLVLMESGPYAGIVHTLAFAPRGQDLFVGSLERRITVLRGRSIPKPP